MDVGTVAGLGVVGVVVWAMWPKSKTDAQKQKEQNKKTNANRSAVTGKSRPAMTAKDVAAARRKRDLAEEKRRLQRERNDYRYDGDYEDDDIFPSVTVADTSSPSSSRPVERDDSVLTDKSRDLLGDSRNTDPSPSYSSPSPSRSGSSWDDSPSTSSYSSSSSSSGSSGSSWGSSSSSDSGSSSSSSSSDSSSSSSSCD